MAESDQSTSATASGPGRSALGDSAGSDEEFRREAEKTARCLAETERITGRGSWIWDIRDDTVTWTDQLYRVFGLEPGEVEPSYEGYISRIHPDDRDSVMRRIGRALETGESWEDTKRAVRADGTEFYLATQGDVITDDDGRPIQMFGVCGDVTSEIESERTRAQFEALVESSHDAIVVQDLEGRIIAWSPGAIRVFGYRADEVMGRRPEEFLAWEDYEDTRAVIDRILAGESTGAHHLGVRSRADGSRFPTSTITSPVKGRSGLLVGTACIIRDISESQRPDAGFEEDTDPVTGLASRARFVRRLGKRHEESGGTLIRCDLDNFRLVNERYGHEGGDLLLEGLARVFERVFPTEVEMARLGGDEFAMFFPGGSEQEAVDLARETLEQIRGFVHPIDGVPVATTASLGVAHMARPGMMSADEMLAVVDRALLDAKEHGKDRYVIARQDDLSTPADWFEWGARLRSALAEDRLELYLQPIVSVPEGDVVMHEVLVRMREGDEIIGPDRFLGTAEHMGLIHEVDRTVVRKSLELLEKHPTLRLSVNLSGKSLDDVQLLNMLETQLRARPIGPGRLVFEVTETSAIVDVEAVRRFSLDLQELGCDFALDDFGTGFGSFAYLKRVPSRYLKIDGDFVAPPRSKTDDVVIDAVVSLAAALGKATVAEHVEDKECLKRVAMAGVDFAQGYHFGRPLPAAEALAD